MPDLFHTDLAILGGGASGMMAAVSAARTLKCGGQVLLLERGPRVGKKLLSTGNGRCNLTNLHASPADYHGAPSAFVEAVLGRFSQADTLAFFESIGLLCREEAQGRVYPYSGQASAVLDLLRLELARLGVQTLCECEITKIEPLKSGFRLTSPSGTGTARRLVLAAGGKAAPSTGSDGNLYPLCRELGLTVTKPFPALTQVKTDPSLTRPLKGLRCEGSVTLWADGQAVRTEAGEIQFTETGLSGICVFQLSRLAGEFFTLHTVNGKKARTVSLTLDLMPGQTKKELFDLLDARKRTHPAWTLEDFLTGVLQKRIGQALLKAAGCAPLSRPASSLGNAELSRIADLLKGWEFLPAGLAAWNQAQVTAGGISCHAFDPYTLEAKRQPGLYAAGELLDVDGDCGGYNLQWAWSSGFLAGQNAARSLIEPSRKEAAFHASHC